MSLTRNFQINISQISFSCQKKHLEIISNNLHISVNYPVFTSTTNAACVSPPFINTRMTGGAYVFSAVFNSITRLFSFGIVNSKSINTCINGDCSLPGETLIVNGGCQSSVTVFTVDYDAPISQDTKQVRQLLSPLVK